jgi:hypothetical protein
MKITLCGSTRFREEYEQTNRFLSINGHMVYSVACFGHSGDPLTPDEKEMLDLVHFKKILDSDAIVVVGEDNGLPYVGDSTRREIRWARILGKPVWFTAYPHHRHELFRSIDDQHPF